MSKLKFVDNEFLEKEELNIYRNFIFEQGFRKDFQNQTHKFGILKSFALQPGIGTNLKFRDDGYYALDADGDLLTTNGVRPTIADPEINEDDFRTYAWKRSSDEGVDPNLIVYSQDKSNIYVPSITDIGYWIKISYIKTPIERGICQIDSLGNLTGTNTEFTKILRSQLTNFPNKIAFVNSVNGNTFEYEVAQVIDDNNAILAGSSGMFNTESDLMYKVIGSFTPGYTVPAQDKDIFQYDSVLLEFQAETILNTIPAGFITDDTREFVIGRVVNNGDTVSYQDRRVNWYKSVDKREQTFDTYLLEDNSIPGIEAVIDPNLYTAKDFKRIVFGWGCRTSDFTIDSDNYKISIGLIKGGKILEASDLNDGDFDGWRVYNNVNSKFYIVKQSIKVGDNINLILDDLIDSEFISSNQLFIVPDADRVELEFSSLDSEGDIVTDETYELYNKVYSSDIKNSFRGFDIPTFNYISKIWHVKYRFIKNGEFTQWKGIGAGDYYNETAFDSLNGNLIIPSRKDGYSGSLITIYFRPDSGTLFNGNKYGVQQISLSDSDIIIRPIQSENYIQILGSTGFSQKRYIKIRRYIDTAFPAPITYPFVEGQSFTIDFRGKVSSGVRELDVIYEFEDGSSQVLIKKLTRFDLERSNFILHIYCIADSGSVFSNNWTCHQIFHEGDQLYGEVDRSWGYYIDYEEGWGGYSSIGKFQLRRNLDRVYYEGGFVSESLPIENVPFATINDGYRPTNVLILTATIRNVSSNEYTHCTLQINPDGTMWIVDFNEGSWTGSCIVYLGTGSWARL